MHYSNAHQNRHFLPWKIIKHSERLKMTKYLSRACATWAKNGQLNQSVFQKLKSHIDTENSNAAWLLFTLVTPHVPLIDPHFVMEYFRNSIHTPEGVGLYTLLQVLRVLYSSVVRLTREEQKLLQRDLVLLVSRFAVPPELIPTSVDIATVVSSLEAGEGNQKQFQSHVDGWAVDIIENIDVDLTNRILNPGGGGGSVEVEDDRMKRQIFTLGELAQICPHRINKRLFLLMQSIIFQQGTKHRRKKQKAAQTDGAPADEANVDIPGTQTQRSQPPECSFTPTTKLQALSIVTLAKMCIQHDDMAKKIVPAFGRLLDTTNDLAIKNNIMYALSDMCVRYASLVDPLLPQVIISLNIKPYITCNCFNCNLISTTR